MVHALRPSGLSEFYLQPSQLSSSRVSSLLVRIFMRHGMYQSAVRFGSLALARLGRTLIRQRPSFSLLKTLRIIRPLISFTPQRMGRIILSLPAPVKSLGSFKAAVRTLLRSGSTRFEKGLITRFVKEVVETIRGRSASFRAAERVGQIVTRNYHLISRFRARKYASRRFPLARYNQGFLSYEFRRFLPRVRMSRFRSSALFSRKSKTNRARPFPFRVN